MMEAVHLAQAFAPAERPVVLHGETGSGKTYFAEYIHRLSGRHGGFHALSIGTVPPQLVADKLFGHVKGAFTDAQRVRAGLIATAGCGTLLLDDLQKLDLGLQQQLYEVLDRRTYSPVGSDRVVSVVCRVVLAMTEDPDVLMSKGLLVPDLRYRFGVCAIRVPPLRERRPEIPILARKALDASPVTTKVDGPTRFHKAALAMLCEAEYKGNVRHLIDIVERAYLLAHADGRDEICPQDLEVELSATLRYRRHGDAAANRAVVERMLELTGGNVKAAAQRLGVSRTTINAVRVRQEVGLVNACAVPIPADHNL
jgi:DNA-binding NtrC family response regulator